MAEQKLGSRNKTILKHLQGLGPSEFKTCLELIEIPEIKQVFTNTNELSQNLSHLYSAKVLIRKEIPKIESSGVRFAYRRNPEVIMESEKRDLFKEEGLEIVPKQNKSPENTLPEISMKTGKIVSIIWENNKAVILTERMKIVLT